MLRLQLAGAPAQAQACLDAIKKSVREGWCDLVEMKPSKQGGYIQVSYDGQNKFASLQEVTLWAGGYELRGSEQASHLCGRPACRVPGHVIPESPQANNARKNCLVWIPCPHCERRILVCQHEPCCVKFAEGFTDMKDLRARGVCATVKI